MANTQRYVSVVLTSIVTFTLGTNTVTVFILGGAYNPISHMEIQFKNREQMWSEPVFYVHIDISPADTLFASFSFILYIRRLPTLL